MLIDVTPKGLYATATQHARKRRFLLMAAIVLVYSILMVVLGAVLHKNHFFGEFVTPYLRSSWNWPAHRISGAFSAPDRLAIDINWPSYQRLAYQREQWLNESVLLLDNDAFVPCRISANSEEARASIRLKGDNTSHLEGIKWSFRIKVRGDHAVFGMRQFSLHHPKQRNWLFEWLAHKGMAREGLIALRYDFIDVTLNGRNLGIYALEEHFEKRLIEHNARREGPIVRFDEGLMWREIGEQLRPFPGAQTSGAGGYLASEPDGFQSTSALSNPEMWSEYLQALQLLDRFRRGELKTSEVFDIQQLAKYFALIDLFGARHGAVWHNIRFYYNPVTCRLEPISFDTNAGAAIRSICGMDDLAIRDDGKISGWHDRFFQEIFKDVAFFSAYLSELERISSQQYLDDLLADLKSDLDKALAVLYSEYPYYTFSPGVLYDNQRYIRTVLRPAKGVHAHMVSQTLGAITLRVGNIQTLPVIVCGVKLPNGQTIETPRTTVLQPRRHDALVQYETVTIPLPSRLPETQPASTFPALLYRVLGTDLLREAFVGPNYVDYQVEDATQCAANTDTFDFITVDSQAKEIRIRPGRWRMDRDMIVPPGFTVVCGAGTELDMTDSAFLLSRSPLLIEGTSDAPVVLDSSDGTGRGLVVLQSGRGSSLSHVRFTNLASAGGGHWAVTGAVTFYEAPVVLNSCVFHGNHSEDALNLIRSDFKMQSCEFSAIAFDAFDSDFSRGSITQCAFRDCGNDAIDVSGSAVEIVGAKIARCGDKGLSVGEASQVTASDVCVDGARMGLVSKDRSELLGREILLTNCRYGLAAYQKKPEFGPGTLRLTGLQFGGPKPEDLIERGSTAEVDGSSLAADKDRLADILYPSAKGAPVAR